MQTRVFETHQLEWLRMPVTESGEGWVKVINVDEEKRIAIFAARFGPGCRMFPHTHHADIVAYTVSGTWEYEGLRLPAGAIAYEQAGSKHTPYSEHGAEVMITAFGRESDEYIVNHLPDGSDVVFDSATLKQLVGMTQADMDAFAAAMTEDS